MNAAVFSKCRWAIVTLLFVAGLASLPSQVRGQGEAPQSVIAFGLTNTAIGPARLSFQGNDLLVTANGAASNVFQTASSTIHWSNSVPTIDTGYYGVSVHLGEADSGIFFYPYTYSGLYNGGLMVGRLYGQMDGQPDELLTTMYAVRTDYATFVVGSDFTPLGATNVTFEVYNGETRVAVSSNQVGTFVILADYEHAPRANPLQRLADGSLAAVVELSSAWNLIIPGVTNEYGIYGDRIVMRPQAPTVTVDFASRLDVTSGGGLNQFAVTDERLGVFRRGHRALGQSLLIARDGKLTIEAAPETGGSGTDPGTGVLVELDPNRHFDLSLQPVELAADGAMLSAAASGGLGASGTEFLGQASIANTGSGLRISGSFPELESGLLLSVYRDDVEVGTVLSPTPTPEIGISGSPRVAGFSATSESGGERAGLAIRLDRNVIFALPGGTSLEGNQFRFRAAAPEAIDQLNVFSLIAAKVPAFTITSESGLESLYLVDYLPEFAVPAAVKAFAGVNQGASEMLTQRVSGLTRAGEKLIASVETPTAGPARSQWFSYRESALYFHGGAEAPLELFSAGGVRLLPLRPSLGQTYHGIGSFAWHHSETGSNSPVTVSVATHVTGFELVSVPAGTYDALRLDMTFTFSPSAETNGPVQRIATWWLVDGVGLVRRTETDQFADGATRTRSVALSAFNIITTARQHPVANVGATIRLNANGPAGPDSAEPTTAQWFKDGALVTDATNATLELQALGFADAGEYSMVRSNAAGQLTVAAASLRIIPFNEAPTFRAVGATTTGFVDSTHLAVDAQGNTYLAGTFAGTVKFGSFTLTSPTQADPVYVVKYDPNGNVLWAREGGGPRIASLIGIGLDAAGNLSLAGLSRGEVTFGTSTAGGGGTQLGMWVTRMNPAGDFLWAAAPTGSAVTYAEDAAFDSAGNVYVVGNFSGEATFGGTTLTNEAYYSSIFISKVDVSGQFLWAKQVRQIDYGTASAVSLDPAGNLAIGGNFSGTTEFGNIVLDSGGVGRGFLAKLTPNGDFLSARVFGAGIYDLGFDHSGHQYVLGWYSQSVSIEGLPVLGLPYAWYPSYLARLAPDGSIAWAKSAVDFASSPREKLLVEPNGGFYMAGTFYDEATVAGTTFARSGALVSRFDRDGRRISTKHVTGVQGVSHGGMALDGDSNFYLAGLFYGSVQLGDTSYPGTTRNSPYLVKMGAVAAPEIQTGPVSQTVNPGDDVTFTVTATGANLLFEWRQDGIPIEGAHGPTLNLADVTPQHIGAYTVSVRNSGGSVLSAPAQLQLNLPNAGTLQFSASTYSVNEASGVAMIEITRTGNTAAPTTVSMQTTDKSAVAGLDYLGTVATLAFAAGEAAKTIAIPIVADGLYELEETVVLRLRQPGAGATIGSPNVATLAITDDDPVTPMILTQPRDRAVVQGRTAVFTVEANGEAPLTYQWRKDGSDLAGATSATLAIADVQADDAGAYSVVVRNNAGETVSAAATLTVRFPPVILVQPQSITVAYGEPVTLSIVASNNIAVITNRISGSGNGTAEARFPLPTTGLRSVLQVSFDFKEQADVLRVYDGVHLVYDSSYVVGTGTVVIPVAPGVPRSLEIVVNGDASGGEDAWAFQAELVSRPIEYQWRKDNQILWGMTEPVYFLANARTWDAGQYTVLVSDAVGSVTSQAATLTVTPPILQVTVATNAPGSIQLWWISPDHRPEFIEDLSQAAELESWTLISDFFSGMTVETTSGQRYFRLRPFSD